MRKVCVVIIVDEVIVDHVNDGCQPQFLKGQLNRIDWFLVHLAAKTVQILTRKTIQINHLLRQGGG